MIHPTAIVAEGARIGQGVHIGPYTVIDGNVTVGDHCRIGPHVYITGTTRIGAHTRIHKGADIGDEPQDHSFEGQESYTEIGAHCVLREYVTIHRGSEPGTTTRLGDHVMMMGFSHAGHNCVLGDHVVVANATLLAGHVTVEDRGFISGGVLVHQFVRIGTTAMIGGGARVPQDVPPYCMVVHGEVQGPNVVGLRRAGLPPANRKAVRAALKLLYFNGLNRTEALAEIGAQHNAVPEVAHLVEFVQDSRRGIMPGRRPRSTSDPHGAPTRDESAE